MELVNKSSLSIVKFRTGSYVMIENEPANSQKNGGAFFIIQSGRVRIETLVNHMLGVQSQILGPGSFFGVISAMSSQEANETAVTLTDCSMIMVKRAQFGDLVLEAPAIALKIIRALSRDLRRYDNELAANMVDADHSKETADKLFQTGEFFYNAKNPNHAAMVFTSYIENHPEGSHKQKAQNYLDRIGITVESPKGFNRTYQDGEMVCAEHMPGSELYVIQSGKVKITKIIETQEIILAILDAGEIVGEMSLLDNKDRTANIIALGETQIMAVNKNNFEKIILQNEKLAIKLLMVLADRLWTIYKQLANSLIEDPLTRLWDTLLTQLLKQHVECDRRAKHQFTFGKTELIKMCGLATNVGEEAFEKLLNHRCMSLTEEGMIHCNDLEEFKKTVDSAHHIEIRARKRRMVKQ